MSNDDGAVVAQLLSDGKYDLDLFLRYLRSFAISGEQPDKAILLGILLQSLARFNKSDFTVCMCLVASHVQSSPLVENELAYIYELENFLSCGAFARFWQQWAEVKEHLPESFNYETLVRTSILDTISFTMESITTERLAQYLSVPIDQVARTVETAKKQGGEFELVSCTDKMVTFVKNEFNHPECDNSQNLIKFTDAIEVLQQR